ncbi:MAG TPA: RhuM family protein [Gallionella sp.]|nr:RhuM family protein [Gallionella sp.]
MSQPTGQIAIYQSADGSIATEVRMDGDTVWLSQKQMSELFDKDVRTINEHIINAFEEGELAREATIRNFRIVRQEGRRQVEREIEHYNLDVIISVGYRVKSRQGTQFRIWATQRLREYLVQGYTLNQQRLEAQQEKLSELRQAIALSARLIHDKNLSSDVGRVSPDMLGRAHPANAAYARWHKFQTECSTTPAVNILCTSATWSR